MRILKNFHTKKMQVKNIYVKYMTYGLDEELWNY